MSSSTTQIIIRSTLSTSFRFSFRLLSPIEETEIVLVVSIIIIIASDSQVAQHAFLYESLVLVVASWSNFSTLFLFAASNLFLNALTLDASTTCDGRSFHCRAVRL